MVGNQEALYREVVARPVDIQPRKVWADWLSERGDPRGEFVRLQCALEELDFFDSRREELQGLAEQLLQRHRAAWCEPLRELVARHEHRCGAVEWAAVEIDVFLERGPQLMGAAPLRCIKFQGDRSRLEALARCPTLGEVESISLSSLRMGAGHSKEFFQSPHLGNLVGLNVAHNSLGKAGLQALCGAHLPQLRRLDVEKNNVKGAAAKTLFRSDILPQLEWLSLRQNAVKDDDFAIWEDRDLSSLQTLDVSENGFLGRGEAAAHVANSSCRPRFFVAYQSGLNGERVGSLVEKGFFQRAEGLDFQWNRDIGEEGGRALASAEMPNLRALSLYRCGITDAAVQALTRAPWFEGLRGLDLFDNALTDAAGDALLQSGARLRWLVLRGNAFSEPMLERLASRFGDALTRKSQQHLLSEF